MLLVQSLKKKEFLWALCWMRDNTGRKTPDKAHAYVAYAPRSALLVHKFRKISADFSANLAPKHHGQSRFFAEVL